MRAHGFKHVTIEQAEPWLNENTASMFIASPVVQSAQSECARPSGGVKPETSNATEPGKPRQRATARTL
jgi:hypothetical protein